MDLFQLMRNHKCLPNHAVENRQAQLLVIDVVIRKYALMTVNENFDKFFTYFTLDGWKTVQILDSWINTCKLQGSHYAIRNT